jgi:acetyl esterase/lipase
MNRTRRPAFLLPACAFFLALLFALFARAETDLSGQRIYRVMCVTDSNSPAWQYPLWDKLFTAGYLVDYVGSQTNHSRIGPLKKEASSNQTAENFRKQPADIVLLDASAADEAIIRAFREANPSVAILLIQSPDTRDLAKLNTTDQPVILVHASSNPEKMAERWFDALEKILEPPKQSYHPKTVVYKKASDAELTLHIFNPPHKFHGPHPAIAFFFGGGWKVGTPIQFYAECAHFAEEGFVAISADYRIESVERTTPFDSVTDGKSAIRYVRAHAKQFNIDPDRIVGAGASAGGQVAAAAATIKGLDDPDDNLDISPRPDALILWYAVIDNSPDGYGYSRVKERYREISPLHNITSNVPPTLFMLGTKDKLIPVPTAANFKARIDKAGGRCDLKLFNGAPHGFGDYRKGDNQLRRETIADADDFLRSLNFMAEQP